MAEPIYAAVLRYTQLVPLEDLSHASEDAVVLRFRDWVAILAMIVGAGLWIKTGEAWGAASCMSGGIAVALSARTGEIDSMVSGIAGLLSIFATIAGIVGALIGSHVANPDDARFNRGAQSFFLDASMSFYGSLDERAMHIAEAGFKLCAIQPYRNIGDVAFAASAAIYSPVSVSLVADAWDLMSPPRQKASCLSAYQAFRKIRPDLVGDLERQYDAMLRWAG